MATINELLAYGKNVLEQSGNEYAKYERKVLLEEVLGITYMQMLVNGDETVEDSKRDRYEELIRKRAGHYPLQYMLGVAHFMDYSFYVDESVLIPRSDTEILVELADKLLGGERFAQGETTLLDLCCGSGCIGLSLLLYHRGIRLTLSDISKEALSVARRNAEKYGLNVELVESDLFEQIRGRYRMIVCNPPYIEREIIGTLSPEVRDYEPRLALDGGESGLDFYERIIDRAPEFLDGDGYLLFEIGYNQGSAVSDRMKNKGFAEVKVYKDYAGLDRVVSGHL